MSDNLRIAGIVSNFDTDSMVKDLMKAENLKLDKLKKEKTLLEWKQVAYTELIDKMSSFKSTYFDVLNSKQNITSKTFFSKFNYHVTSGGQDSNIVDVTASASMAKSNHVINEISQLASADTWSGNKADIRGITTQGYSLADLKSKIDSGNLSFNLSIGNNTKKIEISNSELSLFASDDELVGALNQKISEAFGSEYDSIVSNKDGQLNFDLAGSELKVLAATSDETMEAFGLGNGASSYQYKSKTVKDIFGFEDADLANFSINGTEIELSADDSIEKMMSKINTSAAGVKLSYDSLNDQFTMIANKEGVANNISFEDGSSAETVLSKLFNTSDLIDATGKFVSGDADSIQRDEGVNAHLTLDGVSITQSSNAFTVEGVNYTLNDISVDAIDIEVDTDVDEIVSNVKEMVSKYNEIMEYAHEKVTQKKDRDYEPLTDEEREAMSEDEIKRWEEKAKQGILYSSDDLEGLMTAFRNAFIAPVKDVGLTMQDIGLQTTSYRDYGKITVDEDKLKAAVENNYEDVVKLFTNDSEEDYFEGDRKVRFNENGLGERLSDVLDDYVRTSRDKNGNKGLLVMKAGIRNDASETTNMLFEKLKDMDKRIDDYLDYLNNKEDSYYAKFTAMETALSRMNAQMSSLSSLGVS